MTEPTVPTVLLPTDGGPRRAPTRRGEAAGRDVLPRAGRGRGGGRAMSGPVRAAVPGDAA
ncbi:hypothetical protein [Streptomyces sp. NPDC049813]|uniref:hypothetical protein n=1 Tax=Streptomyces sp. NPDC049813 TaxID=3365597 RepID=UPI0037B9CA14